MAPSAQNSTPSAKIAWTIGWNTLLTYVAVAITAAYVMVLGPNLYKLFNPVAVKDTDPGHSNIFKIGEPLDLYVYASSRSRVCESPEEKEICVLLWKENDLRYGYHNGTLTKIVPVPSRLLQNAGASRPLFLHVWFARHGSKPPQEGGTPVYSDLIVNIGRITQHRLPRAKAKNLLSDQPAQPVSINKELHLATEVNFALVIDERRYPWKGVPADYAHMLRLTQDGSYYFPIVFFNTFVTPVDRYEVANRTGGPDDNKIVIHVNGISVGSFRLYSQMALISQQLQDTYGFSDTDLDALRSLLFNNSPTVLAVTFLVTLVHILFDFLAFKNDIGYWRKRRNMQGLSTRAVVMTAITQVIVFLYLKDNDASMLVLAPAGIQALIDAWKMKKALKWKVKWAYGCVPVGLEHSVRVEKDECVTEEADIMATKYMNYALAPLMVGYACYSLVHHKHHGFYSWILSTLTGYFYAFGFIMMMPQLFINYRLKSVAHLPWRALCYKAFVTFIDDIFAFIIYMPTMHRLACLRDDVIFVCFLYQLWIYPVDPNRVNEFGFSLDDVAAVEHKGSGVAKQKAIDSGVKHSDQHQSETVKNRADQGFSSKANQNSPTSKAHTPRPGLEATAEKVGAVLNSEANGGSSLLGDGKAFSNDEAQDQDHDSVEEGHSEGNGTVSTPPLQSAKKDTMRRRKKSGTQQHVTQ